MEFAASKRRKTSPSTHISVTRDSQTRPTSQDGQQHANVRASFMSPTKASLARFNPNLLPSSNANDMRQPQSQRPNSETSRPESGTNGLTTQNASIESAEPALIIGTPTVAPSRSANGQGLRATPRRRSRTPGKEYTQVRSTQPFVIQNQRASPPEEARDQGDGVHTTDPAGQAALPPQLHSMTQVINANGAPPASESPALPSTPTHRGVPAQTLGMGFSEDGEPSLPSTPVQLGLEAPPERPKGLLFSSPSRTSKRKAMTAVKSSPLKPDDAGAKRSADTSKRVLSSLGPRIYISTAPRPPPTAQEAEQLRMRDAMVEIEKQLQDIESQLIRQTLISRWHQKDSCEMKNISKLNKDVSIRVAKILRSRGEVRQYVALEITDQHHQDASVGIPQADHINSSSHISPLKASPAQRLAHFLPFGKAPRPPTLESRSQDEIDLARFSVTGTPPEGAIAPFDIRITSLSLLPPISDSALLQRQDIILTSLGQLLRAKIRVTIDLTEQIVTELHLLELSQWAHQELGTWFTAFTGNKDISAIGAAFGNYHAASKERAQCFHDLEKEFRTLLDDERSAAIVELPDLLSYLGRQDLTFSRKLVALDISWFVSLSDDGEVNSQISAKAKFPDTWQQTEGGADLAKVGEAFDMLVKDRGTTEAIRVICTIMFPS